MTPTEEHAKSTRTSAFSGGSVLILFHAVILAGALIYCMFDPMAQFATFGAASALVISLPTASSSYRVLSPWTMVVLVIIVGCEIRGAAITFGWGEHGTLERLFLLGQDPSYFFMPSLYYLLGIAVMTLAYSARSPTRQPAQHSYIYSRLRAYQFDRYIGIICAAFALIGAVAFILYVQRTGGFNFTTLSAKRTTIGGLELGHDYQSYGVIRYLHSFSSVAFWIYLAHLASSRRKHSPLSGNGLIVLILFLNAASLPFYTSSRSGIAYILIIAVSIELSLSRRRLSRKLILGAAGILLLILGVMTVARTAQYSATGESSDPGEQIVNGVQQAIVYNRNFGDIQTTAHIINGVPRILPYEYGGTITGWLAAPVPRAIWPDKPILSLGPTIGVKIYGNARSGVPPGFLGEMYWDWGIFGILIGSFILGRLLSWINKRLVPSDHRSPGLTACYCVGFFPLGYHIWATGVGQSLFGLVTDLTLLLITLWFCGRAQSTPPRHDRWKSAKRHTSKVRAY